MAITGDGNLRTFVFCRGPARHALWFSDVAYRNADQLDPRRFASMSPGDGVTPDEPSLTSTTCPVCGANLYKSGQEIAGDSQSSVRWALGVL